MVYKDYINAEKARQVSTRFCDEQFINSIEAIDGAILNAAYNGHWNTSIKLEFNSDTPAWMFPRLIEHYEAQGFTARRYLTRLDEKFECRFYMEW